jgi:hypothetical protein
MVIFLVASLMLQTPVRSASAGVLEYRLEISAPEQGPGQTFKWRNEPKQVELERRPFMTAADFQLAKVIPAGRVAPGRYGIELIHSAAGVKKYRRVADRDRERQFSILVDGQIVQSYAFPPPQKGLYERGNTIYGPFTKSDATALANRINAAIRRAR